jgi:hypothetical protein
MSTESFSRPNTAVLPVSATLPWLLGAALLGLLIYYFVGIDEGATSVFGNSMMVHEFVHDARHYL